MLYQYNTLGSLFSRSLLLYNILHFLNFCFFIIPKILLIYRENKILAISLYEISFLWFYIYVFLKYKPSDFLTKLNFYSSCLKDKKHPKFFLWNLYYYKIQSSHCLEPNLHMQLPLPPLLFHILVEVCMLSIFLKVG